MITIKMNNFEKKLIKYIDYIYLSNYINNNIVEINAYYNFTNDYDWKIFSNHKFINEINILYLIKCFKLQKKYYSKEILLISIYVYISICKKYAHLIDNYTFLFGSIYITINKYFNDEYLTTDFLSKILNINKSVAIKMTMIIEKYIENSNLYYGNIEKLEIINSILA